MTVPPGGNHRTAVTRYHRNIFLTIAPLFLLATLYSDDKWSALSSFSSSNEATLSDSTTTTTTTDSIPPSFTLHSTTPITEYSLTAHRYIHTPTASEILLLQKNPTSPPSPPSSLEKAFSITFRTPPSDSTGIPHILEHSVLCGSRNYHTKEPFQNLLQSSLSTFLNAMTFPDKTIYLFSSRSEKDFYNMVDVYMDAVLYPRAVTDEMVLRQEGWRLEPIEEEEEEEEDVVTKVGAMGSFEEETEKKMVYRGVVLNEMRGAYSSSEAIASRLGQHLLFPDTTYQYSSGGDPKIIPTLTFQNFTAFHKKFYHPTNARVVATNVPSHGEFLKKVEGYFEDFEREDERRVESQVKWQKKRFGSPKREIRSYSSSQPETDGSILFMKWLLNDEPLSDVEEMAWEVLEDLLVGSDSSVLKKALMDSELGSDMLSSGVEGGLLQQSFETGMKGVKEENLEIVEELIMQTLKGVVEEGFDEGDIKSAMNKIDFEKRDPASEGDPIEINRMISAVSKWNYDADPLTGLTFATTHAALSDEIRRNGSQIFQRLLQDQIISNNHAVILTLKPSATLEEEQRNEEKERIKTYLSTLPPADVANIRETAATLKKLQATPDTPEAVATIPTLGLADLPPYTPAPPLQSHRHPSGPIVLTNALPSNGIIYVDIGVDVSNVHHTDVALLPLYSSLTRTAGTSQRTGAQLERDLGMFTGGAGAEIVVNQVGGPGSDTSAGNRFASFLFLRGRVKVENAEKLLELMGDMLVNATFTDTAKTRALLKERVSALESRIQQSGHVYANTRLMARYSPYRAVNENMSGISALEANKKFLNDVKEGGENLLKLRLEAMRERILSGMWGVNMIINLTGDEENLKVMKTVLDKFIPTILPNKNLTEQYEMTESDAGGSLTSERGISNRLIQIQGLPHPWSSTSKASPLSPNLINEGFIVPTKVSYVVKGAPLYPPKTSLSGAFSIVSDYLKGGYLWDNVRVLGGAYGGFCSLDPSDSMFTFLSYRDPNIMRTLEVYDNVTKVMKEDMVKELTEDPKKLELAIVGTIGSFDGKVLSSREEGWRSANRWLVGVTEEGLKKWREDILKGSVKDFEEFAARLEQWKPSVAVVSSKDGLEEAKDEMEGSSMKMELIEVH